MVAVKMLVLSSRPVKLDQSYRKPIPLQSQCHFLHLTLSYFIVGILWTLSTDKNIYLDSQMLDQGLMLIVYFELCMYSRLVVDIDLVLLKHLCLFALWTKHLLIYTYEQIKNSILDRFFCASEYIYFFFKIFGDTLF